MAPFECSNANTAHTLQSTYLRDTTQFPCLRLSAWLLCRKPFVFTASHSKE